MRQREIAKAVTQGFSKPDAKPSPKSEAPAPAPAPASEPEQKNNLVLAAPTPELNPRNRILKEIAARANADADRDASEAVTVTDDDGNVVSPQAAAPQPEAPAEPHEEPAAEPETPAEPAPAAAAPEAPAAPAVPAVAGIDPEAEYELVVEGVPMKFKGSQIVDAGKRTLQKETAADYKLQLATQALEEARRQAAQQPTPQGAAAPAAPAAPTVEQLSDAQLAEMMQFGQPEQAAKAVAEIRRRPANAVTTEAMETYFRQQLPKIVDHELAFREATRFAQTEYGDLLADPYLGPLFHAEEDKRRAAGNNKPYADLYREIGDDLRKHFNKPKPTGATPPAAPPTRQAAPAPTMQQRQAAKAAAPAAPRLASARLEGGGQEQKPKTREQIIQQMQERRGQRPVQKQA
jgi:hypothetical protein